MTTTDAMVRVTKGCKARDIPKGTVARVTVVELGPKYSHQVQVTLRYSTRVLSFYARHINRLNDPVVNLNDGDPTHTLQIVQA